MAKMDHLIRPAELKDKSRRERKKHETRWRIFDSAVKLMRKSGFDEVSIDEICEEADVARATFFQHFSNKAALMRVFSEMVVEEVKDALCGAEATNREKLTKVHATLRRVYRENAAFSHRLFAAFAAEPGGGFSIDIPEKGLTALVAKVIREGQTAGEFDDAWSPNVVSVSLVASWIAASRVENRGGFADTDDPHVQILNLILRGLNPQEG